MAAPVCIPASRGEGSFSPHPQHHLLLPGWLLLVCLTAARGHLIAVVICVSPVVVRLRFFSQICWPFACPLGRSVCSGPLPISQLDRLFGVELCEFFTYFRCQPLSEPRLQISSPTWLVAVLFVSDSCCCAETVSWMHSHSSVFAFPPLAFGVKFTKSSLTPRATRL